MKLSVGLTTYNEEKKLGATLQAIKEISDEIIIVDSHSTDKTIEIAESFGAKVYTEDWKGHGLQKQSVIEKCKGEWILILDADEVVSDKLSIEIKNILANNKYNAYECRRAVICYGRRIKYGGFGQDYVMRLWRKGYVTISDHIAHEQYHCSERYGKIKAPLWHHTYDTLEEYMRKLNNASSDVAEIRYKQGKRPNFIKLILNPPFRFLKSYVFLGGFLDGADGFLMSVQAGFYTFLKYSKLRLMYRNEEK